MTNYNQNQTITDFVTPIVTISPKQTTEQTFSTIYQQLTRRLPDAYRLSMLMYYLDVEEELTKLN